MRENETSEIKVLPGEDTVVFLASSVLLKVQAFEESLESLSWSVSDALSLRHTVLSSAY